MKRLCSVMIANEKIAFFQTAYDDVSTAVVAVGSSGMRYGDLSIQSDDIALPIGQFAVKHWGSSSALATAALGSRHFRATGQTITIGGVLTSIWEIC